MKDSKLSQDGIDIGLLTEQEIYQLQLQALGFPAKEHGGQMVSNYCKSEFRRILTATDSCLYLFIAICGFNVLLGTWCLFGIVACGFNICIGPCSLFALLYNWCLDQIPAPIPSSESLRVGSPESVSIVAEHLMAPVIKSASAFIGRSESERTQIEKVIETTSEIEERLSIEKHHHHEDCLVPLYDSQISTAREALRKLNGTRNRMLEQEDVVHKEIARIQEQIGDMRVLAHASFQLRVVLELAIEDSQQRDEELARRRLFTICQKLNNAHSALDGLQTFAVARATAINEVRALGA